jgi:pyruvate-formate lyase
LTAQCGRNSTVAFHDFLSKQKLNSMGFPDRESVNSIRQALQRISIYGNTTKHHDKSANFNGEQLANDMDTLKEVICKLAEEAKG